MQRKVKFIHSTQSKATGGENNTLIADGYDDMV